ncbi:hypothetical protein RMATCC62417_09871 [Rhizopus microsporus]|nr:hypothetical protein RMATCC62417_09871 [Rhizopus microsporus]
MGAAVRFHPVEILLDASDKDYKTDGLIEIEGIEVCLLEALGHHGLKDLGRFGYDHVKGSFGALTFMRKILKTWCFAKEDTLCKLKVFFIHARGKKMHLWALEMPALEVQVEHLVSSEILLKASEAGGILDVGNLAWKLKDCLKKTSGTLTNKKKEHEDCLLFQQLGLEVSYSTLNRGQ